MAYAGNSVPAEGTASAKSLRPELDIQGAAGTLMPGIEQSRGMKQDMRAQEEGVQVMQGQGAILALCILLGEDWL